jgi:hypothetical protein
MYHIYMQHGKFSSSVKTIFFMYKCHKGNGLEGSGGRCLK